MSTASRHGDVVRRRAARVAYDLVARRLSPEVPGATRLRIWLARYFVQSAHPTAVIRQGARLTRHVVLGERAGVGANAQFLGPGLVTIGRDVIMGPDCLFITGDHPVPVDGEDFRSQAPVVAAVVVQAEAFIGARVTILPGITVGYGAAIGAGAVVAKDVPAGATVVGNPAKVVANRRPRDPE